MRRIRNSHISFLNESIFGYEYLIGHPDELQALPHSIAPGPPIDSLRDHPRCLDNTIHNRCLLCLHTASKGSYSSIFTQGTQPTGPDQKVGGTETAQAVGKAAGTQFAANLSNDLFQNNLGKGLAPMNNIQQQYNGIYNGKVNMLRQIGIA